MEVAFTVCTVSKYCIWHLLDLSGKGAILLLFFYSSSCPLHFLCIMYHKQQHGSSLSVRIITFFWQLEDWESTMHSSRMRTTRLLTVSQHALGRKGVSQPALGRGCLLREGVPGVVWPGGVPGVPPRGQGGIYPGGRCRHPPPWTEWQTGVKTLPCRNFVAGGKNVLHHLHYPSPWWTFCLLAHFNTVRVIYW